MKSNKLYLFFVINLLISLPFKGQQIIYDTITHDSLQRNYIIYVPASYNSVNPIPLVISFHGYGSMQLTISMLLILMELQILLGLL